jgi:hypothetical protein
VKPSPHYDFPVGVSPETAEHSAPVSALYVGVYHVWLNHGETVMFIPAVVREPEWPPVLPDNVDNPTSRDEALRFAIALSSLSVTPDEAHAGTDETFAIDPDATNVIFYVSPAEFDRLSHELESLADRFTGIYDALPVSKIPLGLARLLVDRILPSGHLSERTLRFLGRMPDGISRRD